MVDKIAKSIGTDTEFFPDVSPFPSVSEGEPSILRKDSTEMSAFTLGSRGESIVETVHLLHVSEKVAAREQLR